MKGFHVISGLPRSGSTLLCNILNQNPEFYAGSTSPLPEICSGFVNIISNSMEIKACLVNDSEATQKRLQGMIMGLIVEWYADKQDKVIFDKSRGWPFSSTLLRSVFENIKMIVTVRDLRSVFGSIEKQHQKTPIFDQAMNPIQKTITSRADSMMSPEGIIGQCVHGVEDVMMRKPDNVFVLQYESFTVDPATKIKELYNFLGLPHFEHTYDDIKNTSEDVDSLYLNKFPHQGVGKINPADKTEWEEYVPEELAKLIIERYPSYNQRFGYAQGG